MEFLSQNYISENIIRVLTYIPHESCDFIVQFHSVIRYHVILYYSRKIMISMIFKMTTKQISREL